MFNNYRYEKYDINNIKQTINRLWKASISAIVFEVVAVVWCFRERAMLMNMTIKHPKKKQDMVSKPKK